MESRLIEALEDDIERWECHLTWLAFNPDEPDRAVQIAECERLIEDNRRLLAAGE